MNGYTSFEIQLRHIIGLVNNLREFAKQEFSSRFVDNRLATALDNLVDVKEYTLAQVKKDLQ